MWACLKGNIKKGKEEKCTLKGVLVVVRDEIAL